MPALPKPSLPKPQPPALQSETISRRLPIFQLREDEGDEPLAIPSRQHTGDAGLDLTVSRYLSIAPLAVARVPHNFIVAIPEGYFGMILPRTAALARKGLIVHPGTIDSGYRGEVQTLVFNPRPRTVHLNIGERISQLVVLPLLAVTVVQVKDRENLPTPPEGDDRGAQGFGSTGGVTMGSPADNQTY